ncbi:golvesin C-terminal-like domain-containing protein [Planosporangium mesophilum]|uniref:RHS repeat-associated core domain-containing protein n=1 Tax=Planosporangium mesophilum TaxID=689768 RepID=A0A8J3TIU4_9ACTN|nr:Tox-REase-5 domain-containing protein [Planosporangium mesophilum]NJC86851.1 hypothetical protein [Planosporangium mesophilum]GII26491.1 hypothetical protein Pme01_60880 [Planosporangium mesophilum]
MPFVARARHLAIVASLSVLSLLLPNAVSGAEAAVAAPPRPKPTTPAAIRGFTPVTTSHHGRLVRSAATLPHREPTATSAPLNAAVEATDIAGSAYDAPATPRRMTPGTEYTVPVAVTNTTAAELSKAQYALSYRWRSPDGRVQIATQLRTALPADLAPGATVTLDAHVRSPEDNPFGNAREAFLLDWDLVNTRTARWLSETNGAPALRLDVAVERPTSDLLGLEKFYQYNGVSTGGGSSVVVNAANGNLAFGYNALANPGRGVASFVRFTYNSLDTSDSYVGPGWSLTTSTLPRLGTPLDFQPGPLGYPTKVRLVDGDGTSHVFTLNTHDTLDPKKWDYDKPAGVHLYLQRAAKNWVMTRPDRTQFLFDDDGFQTATVDKNGNTQKFTYERAFFNGRYTNVLTGVTDPAGRPALTLGYYRPGDDYAYYSGNVRYTASNLTNVSIIHQLRTITDSSGRRIELTYSDQGLLQQISDGAGTDQVKAFGFMYDGGSLLTNPKLVRINDPLGHGTQVSYADHSRVARVTDRSNGGLGFTYAEGVSGSGVKVRTTATDAAGHSAVYSTDPYGRPVRLVDATNRASTMTWDADNNVIRIVEPSGGVSTWAYDPLTGYPLDVTDAQANKDGTPGIALDYRTFLNGHVADLIAKTSAAGRKWTFDYDAAGNLTRSTDPRGNEPGAPAGHFATTSTYDSLGRLTASTDANGNTTRYSDYDPVGYPKTTTDALGNTTHTEYDVLGNVVAATDALGKISTYTYDIFKRPLSSRVPKDQAKGVFITTPGPAYDANDNIVRNTDAGGAVTAASYDAMDRTVSIAGAKDTASGPARVTTYEYDSVGDLVRKTEPLGNLTANRDDYVTTYRYDALYRLVAAVNADGDTIAYTYDTAGDALSVAEPRQTATADPNDYSRRFAYDLAHRVVSVTDAAGHTARQEYDRDGNIVASVDRGGARTTYTLNARGDMVEVRQPRDGDTTSVLRYTYDEAGNRTKVISPRGTVTSEPDDFAEEYVYDALNRVVEDIAPYDPADPRFNTPQRTTKKYDAAGRLERMSSPPSQGQSTRVDTAYRYFDNGWVSTSTDAWDIVTAYDYDATGNQTRSTVSGAGGTTGKTVTNEYYPDGKIKSRTDGGIPVGLDSALTDNSDAQSVETTGIWTSTGEGAGYQGFDYARHGDGAATDRFTWHLSVPSDGKYEVSVRYPAGQATDAPYTVKDTVKRVDQTKNAGMWVSLGSFDFVEGEDQTVTLGADANAPVLADAVRLVRDNSGDIDTEQKHYEYAYDANGNLTTLADGSSGAAVDTYAMDYTQLNQVRTVRERKGDDVLHTTAYTYDGDGNTLTRTHDQETASYEYDSRGQVVKITNGTKVTSFTYDARGKTDTLTRGNGNVVDYSYYLDGLLKEQVEKKSGGDLVTSHSIDYDENGNRSRDESKQMNADNHGALINEVTTYTYDPKDRIAKVGKTRGANESYVHDANNNVVSQTIGDKTTTNSYDRNRLASSTTSGVKASYKYDPYGRLSTVSASGQTVQKYTYDGFDRTVSQRSGAGADPKITKNTFDPLDRTTTQSVSGGGQAAKTTTFAYLGLSDQVLTEDSDGTGNDKSYQYAPWGARLSQDKGSETSYYGYNPHTDVEELTDEKGDTRATYGYTAYGSDDKEAFTGVDKPDPQDPSKEPYNAYRFNAKRWDPSSGTYDMGFRDYDPGLNQFLTRDAYGGALNDMRMATDPWTNNRYAFAGGNPVSNVEIDGHCWDWAQGICDVASDVGNWVSENASAIGETALGIASMFLGAAIFEASLTLAIAGGVICLTGVGCIAGGPALAVAGAGMLVGAGVFTLGAGATWEGINNMHSTSSGGSSGGDSGGGLRKPPEGSTDGGPGKWVKQTRGGSDESKAYQEKVTGVERGSEYEVNGVRFDGYDNGTLLEAKDNYLSFLDENGEWKWFFKNATRKGSKTSGYEDLVNEARGQLAASGDTPITWKVSDLRLKAAFEKMFRDERITGITVDVL